MNDFCLSLLYRPPWQQWIVFSFLSGLAFLATYVMVILPEWQHCQHSEQQYQQQLITLTRQRQQFVQLAAPEQQRALWYSTSKVQREISERTPEQFLSASPGEVKQWRTGPPVELQLVLQWSEVSEFFRQIAQLNPPMLPGRFSLEYRPELETGLHMAIWLNRNE